jgi:phage terminase large subunit-like protein
MTIEELEKVKFHFVSHMSMEDEHTTTYASEDNQLGWCKGGASADMDLGNKKPVKRTSSDSCKVDPVQAIIMGMGLMVQYESQNH